MSTRVINSERSTVQYFDMDTQLMPGASILIIGKRACGKSSLLFDLMSRMCQWFSYGLALTPTQGSREKFTRCIPSLFIDKQSPERLDQYVKMVNSTYDKSISQAKDPKKTFLVCDDTAFDRKFMNCKTLSEVFLNGRNFGLTCILVLQYLMKVGPELRCNADFVFVFWDNNKKNQDRLHEFWFNMMPKTQFNEVFSTCTKDYSCLVMDVRKSATSRDWHDCVFWYKATLPDDIPSFQMCEPDFFKMNDYCKVVESEDRKIQEIAVGGVCRLGPDGKVFDVPTIVNSGGGGGGGDNDYPTDIEDEDGEDDIKPRPPNTFKVKNLGNKSDRRNHVGRR